VEWLPTDHVHLDVRSIQRTVIDTNRVDAALENSPQTLFPPMRSGLLDNLDRPGLWALHDPGAIVS
jgi:hypothetical protein